MTTNQRPILTLGHNSHGDPIIPQKLLQLARERQEEEAERKARASAREEFARIRHELRERHRQAAELQKEREDRQYHQAVERLQRKWEAEVAKQKCEAELKRAQRAAEIARRERIMTQSLHNIEANHHVTLDDFESYEVIVVPQEYYSQSQDLWSCAGRRRHEAAFAMAKHLGQWLNKPLYSCGRGPRSPRKQRRGWKAGHARAWSRREFVESKWLPCFED